MNKWTRKWIPSLLAAVVLASTPVSLLSSTAYAETAVVAPNTLTYEQQRTAFLDALEIFKKGTTTPNMKSLIDTFIQLPALAQYPVAGYQRDKESFSDEIIRFIPFVTTEEGKDNQSELRFYFANEAMKLLESKKMPNDFDVAKKLVDALPAGDIRTSYATKLDALRKEIFHDDSGYIDWLNPPKDLVIAPYTPPKDNKTIPGADPNDYKPGDGKPQPVDVTYDKINLEYKTQGNKCVKVNEYYKDGKIVKTDVTEPDKYEKAFCGMTIDTSKPNPFENAGNNKPSNPTNGVFNGFDPYSQKAIGALKEEEKKDDIEPITIQFTFEKASESPYFYDLGITIGEAKVLTYAQAKDALHMIAIRSKGKFVEDKDQSLALIDGVIILIEDNKKQMALADFAKLFSKTNIEVRALDTRIGEHVEIADLVEIKDLDTVTIGKKNVKLDDKPIVDNSIVLFPLEQIARELGGTIETTSDSVTVKANKHELVYTNGKSSVLLDGKEQNIQVPVRKNKNDVWMAPIRALVDAFDNTLEVENSTVIIK